MFRRKHKSQRDRRAAAGYNDRQKVFSYYASRREPEVRVGRGVQRETSRGPSPSTLTHILLQIPIILSVAAIIAACVYSLLLSAKPRIMIFGTESTSLVHADSVYQKKATEILSQSILSRTKLTVNTKHVEDEMKINFPEISSINVNLPLIGMHPIVQIETLKPSFLLSLSGGNDRYFLLPDGRAASKVTDYEQRPTAGLLVINDQSGSEIKPGDQVISAGTVKFINEVILQLKAKNVAVSSLTLPVNSYEIWAYIANEPYYVKFIATGDAKVQSGAFLATKDYLAGKNETPKVYIDVRAEEKAFYK